MKRALLLLAALPLLLAANSPSGSPRVQGTPAGYGDPLQVTSVAADGTAITSPTVAQASTTSGETGQLVQGAVTTAAPTYVTGQTDPLSLDTGGALRVTNALGSTVAAQTTGNTSLGTLAGTVTTQSSVPGIGAYILDPSTGLPLSATNPTQIFTSNSYANITTKTTTTAKSGAGTLASIVINATGSLDTLTIYDNTAGSGTVIATITSPTVGMVFTYNVAFGTGLTIVSGGTTAGNYTVTYR